MTREMLKERCKLITFLQDMSQETFPKCNSTWRKYQKEQIVIYTTNNLLIY